MKIPKVPQYRKNREQREKQKLEERSKPFKVDIAEVVKKHKLDFIATLIATPGGIFPEMKIIDVSERVEREGK